MMADQYQHDDRSAGDHAHDDHPGAGQAAQVQLLRARFGPLFLLSLCPAPLRRGPVAAAEPAARARARVGR